MTTKSNSLRVLMVGPKAPPYGGIQRLSDLYLVGANEMGVEIIRLADNIPPEYRPKIRKAKFTWNIFKRDGIFNTLRVLVFVGNKYIQLIWLILTRRPQIVHVLSSNGWGFFRNSLFIFLSRLLFRKTIFHHLGQFDDMIRDAEPRLLKVIKFCFSLSHIHVTQSQGLTSVLEKYTSKKVYSLYNGVDLGTFISGESESSELQEKYNIAQYDLVFLTVGYLGHSKGTYDILETLKEFSISDGNINIAYLFIGGGEINHFKNLAKEYGLSDKVRYLGELDDDTKVSLLKSVDVFMLPSRAEGQPVAIIEAMAAGLPVISSKVGSIHELIDQSGGWIISPGNKEELAAAIESAINNKELRIKMGKRNKAWALKHHDLHQVYASLKDIYKDTFDV